jgi:hypothetical protein
MPNVNCSFCLFAALRISGLRSGGNLVDWWAVGVLTVRLKVLVGVVITIGMIVSMLASKLMHLLGTCAELVRASIAAHRHYNIVNEGRKGQRWNAYSVQAVAGYKLAHIAGLGSCQGSYHTWVADVLVENRCSSSLVRLFPDLGSH